MRGRRPAYSSTEEEYMELFLLKNDGGRIDNDQVEAYKEKHNREFGTDRGFYTIHRKLVELRTKNKLKVVITSHNKKGHITNPEKKRKVVVPSSVNGARLVSTILKELNAAVQALLQENKELKQQVRGLTEIRAAVEKFQKGGR